eukprot:7081178-Pyramimonas_sp.AAC.1
MLRSTGPKAIASAVNFKLKSMIDRGASKAQRGFIAGRNFLDNLVELDACPASPPCARWSRLEAGRSRPS